MRNRLLIILAGTLAAIGFAGNVLLPVFAATSNGTINVDLTIPSTGGGGCVGPGCGGGGGSDQPPQISSVATSTGNTSANISWTATDDNQLSATAFSFGLTPGLGTSGSVIGSAPNFQTGLTSLATNTLYYFRITATDNANQTAQYLGTFTTQNPGAGADVTPPIISNILVVPGINAANISWDTNELSDSQINFGLTAAYGSTALDNSLVINHALVLPGLLPNTTYHFRISSADASLNSVSTPDATFTTLKDAVPSPDVSNLQVVANTSSFDVSWVNPSNVAVPDFAGVTVVRTIGAPASSVNDPAGTVVYSGPAASFTDSAVLPNVNYYYTVFSYDTSVNYSPGTYKNGIIIPPAPGAEICNNSIDDNGDGKIDCADPQCVGSVFCAPPIIPPTPTPTPTTTVITPTGSTVPPFLQLQLSDISFLAGSRNLTLTPVNSTVTSLAGSSLSIAIPASKLITTPLTMRLVVDGFSIHQFALDPATGNYYADISFPGVGLHPAFIEINYGQGQIDSLVFQLQSLSLGSVTADSQALSGAQVTLYDAQGNLFNVSNFGESSPVLTGADGSFGWVVPNGTYSVTVKKLGYYDRTTPGVTIANNVVNFSVSLVAQPKKLEEVVSATSSAAGNAINIGKNLLEKSRAALGLGLQGALDALSNLQNAANNPAVQQTAATVVAPAAVGVVAVGTLALVSWANLLPLLRLLFLQPLLLVGRRRREGWGQVYNALNKLPVDLATLRLIDVNTGKVVQTKVSDKKGRYAFVANPGSYRIEAVKVNLHFPSELLKGETGDGHRVDIYHGEIIKVTEKDAVITANIPMDPIGEVKKPARLFWARIGRRMQTALSWLGLAITAVSFYISPRWYVGALLGLHIALFLLFRRLAMAPKVKSWGIVYDASNKKPISRVIARLFSSKFNKLVGTQITDANGRYYFLAGDSDYYVTYENPRYAPHKADIVAKNIKETGNVAIDVHLEPQKPKPDPEVKPTV